MAWWVPAAQAGERAPLPALPVERPVGLPRGWTAVDLDHTGADADGGGWTGRVRYGVLPRVELALTAAVATAIEREPRWLDPEATIRATVWRREPPNGSAAIDLRAFGSGGVGARLVAAHALGPILAEVTSGAIVEGALTGDPAPRWTASAAALLQIGPLAPAVSIELDRRTATWVGGWVQASRGVQLRAAAGWIDGAPATRIGAGIAF